MYHRLLFSMLTSCALVCTVPTAPAETGDRSGRSWHHFPGRHAQNIILMVPDGMGLADVTAARTFKNGPNGEPLALETLPVIGYQRTHSHNSTVTDSAAGASAWATGEKFNNGEISLHDNDRDGRSDGPIEPTILELAKARGKATGLVVTADITHATPAAFGAHVHNRKCEGEILRQYLFETQVDVLLGGGVANNRETCNWSVFPPVNIYAYVAEAQNQQGYLLATTRSELLAAASASDKVIGLFRTGGKSVEMFRVKETTPYPAEEPTLAEMTEVALDILEEDKDGFFLLVEGAQVDWRNHSRDIVGMIAETLGFDAAVEVVLEWLAEDAGRARKTTVIIVPDHETGGFAINGPYGILAPPGSVVQAGWTSTGHTAVDTMIWSAGPGSWRLGAAVDNTDIFYVIRGVLK